AEEEETPTSSSAKARRGRAQPVKRSRKLKGEPPPGVVDPWLAPPLEAPPEIDWRAGLPADVVEQGTYGVSEIEPPPPPPPPPLALDDEEPIAVRPVPSSREQSEPKGS